MLSGCQRHWYTAIHFNGLCSAGSPDSKRKWSPGGAQFWGKRNEEQMFKGSVLTPWFCKLQLQLWSFPAYSVISALLSSSLTFSLRLLSSCSSSPSHQLIPVSPSECSLLFFLGIMQLWHSFYNTSFSPKFIFPLYLPLSSVSVSTSSPLSPSPILSSSGQENDYAKQDWDPSMCHQLVPQFPSEGQPNPPPSCSRLTTH